MKFLVLTITNGSHNIFICTYIKCIYSCRQVCIIEVPQMHLFTHVVFHKERYSFTPLDVSNFFFCTLCYEFHQHFNLPRSTKLSGPVIGEKKKNYQLAHITSTYVKQEMYKGKTKLAKSYRALAKIVSHVAIVLSSDSTLAPKEFQLLQTWF